MNWTETTVTGFSALVCEDDATTWGRMYIILVGDNDCRLYVGTDRMFTGTVEQCKVQAAKIAENS